MGASAKELLGVGIRLSRPWSFGLIRKGWGVKVKDMERVVLYPVFKKGPRTGQSYCDVGAFVTCKHLNGLFEALFEAAGV
jgi:hypothetical protein